SCNSRVTKDRLTRNRRAIWRKEPSLRSTVSRIRCRRSSEWGVIAHLLILISIQIVRQPTVPRSSMSIHPRKQRLAFRPTLDDMRLDDRIVLNAASATAAAHVATMQTGGGAVSGHAGSGNLTGQQVTSSMANQLSTGSGASATPTATGTSNMGVQTGLTN